MHHSHPFLQIGSARKTTYDGGIPKEVDGHARCFDEERQAADRSEAAIRLGRGVAAGRVVVYIHAGAMTLPATIRLTQHAHAIGADGIGVVTPMFWGPATASWSTIM